MSLDYFIHPSSLVDEGAQVGTGTKIWHFSHVLSGTVIGRDCSFGQNCMIGPKVKMGDRVKVQNNVSIYEGAEIEDDVFLGPSCVLTNVINPRSAVNRKAEFRKTLLKKGSTVGANATIVCGVTLGEYSFIGAGAVVTKDVAPYALIIGNPGRQSGWMSQHGEKLTFGASGLAECKASGLKYRLENQKVSLV